ncbi:tetratricopeptide repeat protein [candidate division KSB1 bacterium]|nr:tetratricopeptide repeat protein [candidate division KSB1 bacterium]
MIKHRFLVLWMTFLFCIVVVSSTLAQEYLPEIIKKIEPSTVVIITYDDEGEFLGQGSGFFISKDGDIITNWHVLQGASRAEIKTAQGKVYPITQILAEDKEGDIMRVSVDIPLKIVRPLTVSTSIPEVGERVIVIGSPLGLERTVSDGIVSAVREIPAFGKIIQITASISSGSSGSPVVNMQGEVIGVATFQIVEGQNLNFAIPGERVAKLTPSKGKTLAEWEAWNKDEWLASAEGLYLTGLKFYWIEDYEKALPYFEKAVKKNPRYAEAYSKIGDCNLELCYYTEAIEAFKQTLRIKPDHAYAYSSLGFAYLKLRYFAEAIEACKQAIRIKPDDDYAYSCLGLAYLLLECYTEGLEACKQAVRINPENFEAYMSLGIAYAGLKRHQEEIEAYKQAIHIKPDVSEAHYFLGATYGEIGSHQEAIEACKQAIRINPDYAEAHYVLGKAYIGLERYTEGIKANKQAIRIKPDYAEAHFVLGLLYIIIGNKGSALDVYKILKELDKELANELFNQIYK